MNASTIIRFVILGAIWLLLVLYILLYSEKLTLMTWFWIVASAIIIFVPLYKKYVKNDKR